MKERILALLLSLTITLSYADAQSYETPEYSFQQFELGDTIDIYANDTLTINHQNSDLFVSLECGCFTYHTIESIN